VTPLTTDFFDLPTHLSHKADPALVAADEEHFAAIARSLDRTVTELNGSTRSGVRRPATARPPSSAIRRCTASRPASGH
jgi:hypothetical protein